MNFISSGLLNKTGLYLSNFIKRNKAVYYDSLTLVRTQNNLTNWLKFFLTAVIETAKNDAQILLKISKLKEEIDLIVVSFGKKSQNAKILVDFLYHKPIISAFDIIEPLNISKPTANLLIKDFVAKGILVEVTGLQRNKLYTFERYLDVYSKV